MSSVDHLGAVRKQLHPGHTSSASKLLSDTSGHYNQLLHLDDFSDSSRTPSCWWREWQRLQKMPKGLGLLGPDVCAVPGMSRERGRDDPTQQHLPLPPPHTLSAAQGLILCWFLFYFIFHSDFMLPMSHPVGGGLVYAGGELCLYSHINWKCIKPVSYPGLCTYFISASYSALSQPQYFVFLVWKLIKKIGSSWKASFP